MCCRHPCLPSLINTCPPFSSCSHVQVVVTSSTLPSPRCLGPPPLELVQPQLTTQPSVTSKAPSTEMLPGSPLLEHTPSELAELEMENERDNEIIDRLLRGASEDIEDVKARSISRSQANLSRDKRDFLEACTGLLAKVAGAQDRLGQLDKEADLELRADLIEVETQELEAEVATTISRGETLVLLIHRQSAEQAQSIQVRVDQLREEWRKTKQLAEGKRLEAKHAEKEVARFTSVCSGLLVWLAEVEKRLEMAKENPGEREAVAAELEAKQGELETTNKLAERLRKVGALQKLEASLTSCNFRWEQARQECRRRSKSVSPMVRVSRAKAAEITSRMSRVREAIGAVETQLRTTVLRGRRFENLDQQEEMLGKVKSALETLRPRVRKTEKEVEGLSGSLAMEQYEQLTGQAEKCRLDWSAVNTAYQVRRSPV